MTPAMLTLLVALSDGDEHGYALIGKVEALTSGAITLGPGTLYRTLQRLVVDELIVDVGGDRSAERADRRAERRRRYSITPAGERAAAEELRHLHVLVTSRQARVLLASQQPKGVSDDA